MVGAARGTGGAAGAGARIAGPCPCAEPNNEALRSVLTDIDELPFLAIESDGSPFPQLINAKLETFCLRAERLHKRILDSSNISR